MTSTILVFFSKGLRLLGSVADEGWGAGGGNAHGEI